MTTRKQIQDQAIRNSLINNKITHTMRKKQGYPDLYKVTYKLRNISQGHVWNELENTKRTRIYIGVTKNV